MRWSAWAVEAPLDTQREVHLLVTAQGEADEPRAPVLVNLVLDRSGSMKGAPLAAAVEAAQQLVELAQPDDFLGLVLFDGVAEQRVPLSQMDARGKAAMVEALHGVQTGRGTALHHAVELALKGVQRTLVPGRQPRLLILTDGEPSVGPDTLEAFERLGHRLAAEKLAVHALGLARHYVPEVLEALTRPSGNAYEHVDGPEGLGEAMGALLAHVLGLVASEVSVRVQPTGLASLTCRHAFPSTVDAAALTVALGDVSRGWGRRVLFSGVTQLDGWSALVHGSARTRGEVVHQKVEVERVPPDSPRGRLVLGLGHELDLVSAETAAWLSLARKDLARAEQQLEEAEARLRQVAALAPEGLPVRRHLERLSDLRLAVERGEGDLPLLIRRAHSARAGTHVSQVIPMMVWRQRGR